MTQDQEKADKYKALVNTRCTTTMRMEVLEQWTESCIEICPSVDMPQNRLFANEELKRWRGFRRQAYTRVAARLFNPVAREIALMEARFANAKVAKLVKAEVNKKYREWTIKVAHMESSERAKVLKNLKKKRSKLKDFLEMEKIIQYREQFSEHWQGRGEGPFPSPSLIILLLPPPTTPIQHTETTTKEHRSNMATFIFTSESINGAIFRMSNGR